MAQSAFWVQGEKPEVSLNTSPTHPKNNAPLSKEPATDTSESKS